MEELDGGNEMGGGWRSWMGGMRWGEDGGVGWGE